MEHDELMQLLESEEVQAVLNEKYVAKTEVEKIEAKKNQLLSEKKKVQEKTKTLEEELGKFKALSEKIGQMGYDPDEKLAEFIATLETGTPEGAQQQKDLAKSIEDRLVVQQRTHEAKLKSLADEKDRQIAELKDALSNTIRGWDAEKIENALNQELDRIDVLPAHKKVLKAAFRNLAKVDDDEDGVRGVLMTNDEGLTIPAKDFFDAFAQSDEGKAYIAAQTTTGGGALGGKGTKNAIDFTAERGKALQQKDTEKSVGLAYLEYRKKLQTRH